MTTLDKRIKDIISFYIRENYKHYISSNNITSIEYDKIPDIVNILYTDKKEHIQTFVKDSLKIMLKDEIPEDLIINNILNEIFSDDELCKNRLIMEIRVHQNKGTTKDYKKII
tara:strand:- start:217 stop:555 length:339 start_codon:yes stop_codon:yes gene_type:complete